MGSIPAIAFNRPVYIESRVYVLKDVVKCSFEYVCVVHHTCRQHNVGVGEGTIKKKAEEHFGTATSPSRFFILILIITHNIKLFRKCENLFIFTSCDKILKDIFW